MIRNFFQAMDYENGYDKALLDVKNWFTNHSDSLTYYKMYNRKGIKALLSAFIDNKEEFEKYAEDTEFVMNKDDKGNIEIKLGKQDF